VLSFGLGCNHHKKDHKSAEACATCEKSKESTGKVDCSACKAQTGAESVTKTSQAEGDACTHCPGVQAAKADGTCSACPAKAQ